MYVRHQGQESEDGVVGSVIWNVSWKEVRKGLGTQEMHDSLLLVSLVEIIICMAEEMNTSVFR